MLLIIIIIIAIIIIIVHATRSYLHSTEEPAVLKLDFKNAFNSVRRKSMLEAVKRVVPSLYPFVYKSYSVSSFLYFGDSYISSQEGIQQGDPLGPLLFV